MLEVMSKPVFFFVLILSAFLALRLGIFYSSKIPYREGEQISFISHVLSEPKVYKSYQSFSVETPDGDRIFIKAEIEPEYHFQDRINISSNLKLRLLNNKTRILTMDYPKISPVKSNNLQGAGLAVVNSIRQKIISTFQTTLSKDSSGLMLGIVFGIKQNLSKDFLNNLKETGVMHVIAASGMNVTIVAGLLFYFFSLVLKRQIAIFVSIFGILFYAMLAGFEASIVRASIMGIIAFSSQILGKQQYGFYALLLTGFLMLFLWPKYLIDIGFQLSFAATAGILFIPILFKKRQNLLSEDFLTTFSAQASTMPIVLSNFGTYSVWSIVVNVLVLWTVPFLMILGGIAAIISFIFEPLARLFLYICLPFLVYFEKTVGFFANLNGKILIENVPWQFSLSYYLFLSSAVIFSLTKNNE